MPSEAKRVNITISEAAHERLRELVDSLYGGNFSRFVADAALFYAGALSDAGRQHVEEYVAARQAQRWQLPTLLHKGGAGVSVLICSYCGFPKPEQVDSISADTINVICPHCGNEQVLKGFRPGSTHIPPAAVVRALRSYYSGDREGALDPPVIQLLKRHFAPHIRAMQDFTDEEWADVIADFEAEREQLSELRKANQQREKGD